MQGAVHDGQKRQIAIIGAGWAGLAAGVELSAAGCAVTIFEAGRQPGGRARSVQSAGRNLDNGQHILIGAYHETLRLLRVVGVDPEQQLHRFCLELNSPAAGFRLRLPRLPAPFHLIYGLLNARGCTLSEKIAAARFMRSLQACAYRLPNDCSVRELLDRHGQNGPLRSLLWEALCLAALNTAPENASAQIFVNVLRDSLGGPRTDTDLLLPASGLDQLFPQAAVAFIQAHGGHIKYSSRIEDFQSAASINGQRFHHLILATAPQHAARLLAQHTQTTALAQLLQRYRYEPIGTVYLSYPPEVQLPFPMLGLDAPNSGQANPIGQWVFDRGILTGERGLIACVLSAQGAWEALPNAQLAAALHHGLQQTLGKALPPFRWQQVIREQRATFSCHPGQIRPSSRTGHPGLWLAGDYVCADYPATLEGAVRSGISAARGILTGGSWCESAACC